MEVNHTQQMKNMETKHTEQMTSITTKHISLQRKLQMMEKSQVHELQLRLEDPEDKHKELLKDHNPPSPLNQFPSHCEEVTCHIERG